MKFSSYVAPALGLLSTVQAIDLDLSSQDSVHTALADIAFDMTSYYSGNQTGGTPGILPGPCQSTACYYWWEAGAMWGALINYGQYTGNQGYLPTVLQALEFQIGPDKNYNPPNQSKNMGVDDQDFWGFAAMEAAEAGVPDSTSPDFPSWLALAQAVFNFQLPLWDAETCGGGFRWQVYSFNAGYNLKNTISNGGFFQLAARLARYTGNDTYAQKAIMTWDWMASSPLFQYKDNIMYIWDNTDTNNGCIDVQNFVWSYNYGTMLMGSAMLYNYTNGSALWQGRVQTILDSALNLFFPAEYGGGIMSEILCEPSSNCNNDQSSFKAYLSRWMAVTSIIAPFTAGQIQAKLATSAAAAAGQCVGGQNGRKCGRQWYSKTWDGSEGVGQQMSALAVIGATQITADMTPLTLATGGKSSSDPNAGLNAPHNPLDSLKKITNADRAGAAILTMLVIAFIVGLSVWIVL